MLKFEEEVLENRIKQFIGNNSGIEGIASWSIRTASRLDQNSLKEKYPETLEDAYKQIGNSYFSQKDLDKIEVIAVDNSEWIVFDDPTPDDRYAIGVDVAAGVNRDYSVIFVIIIYYESIYG